MSYQNYNSEEMKENMDCNIIHASFRNLKQSTTEKNGKYKKRQAFKEYQSQCEPLKNIKKHAYIVDSDQEKSPEKTDKKECASHRSIDSVSQIMGSLSKQSSIPVSPKYHQAPIKLKTCTIHQQPVYAYNFCIQCSQYLMCSNCLKETHFSHMILTFNSEKQTKAMSKQFLIQKIQETLQKLKSKENDIKNKSAQMDLILANVKRMEQEVMNKLQVVFREIAEMVRSVYEKQTNLYESKIDEFYQKYNNVGDELRENLLTIIDQSFQLHQFKVSSVCKEPPLIPDPQINKFKSVLQKTKVFYKSLIDSIQDLKQKALQKSKAVNTVKSSSLLLSHSNNNKASLISRRQASTKKYEKFLADTCFQNENTGEISKSSLIKILDTLSK